MRTIIRFVFVTLAGGTALAIYMGNRWLRKFNGLDPNRRELYQQMYSNIVVDEDEAKGVG